MSELEADVVSVEVGITETELTEFMNHNITVETVTSSYPVDSFTPAFWEAVNTALDSVNSQLYMIQDQIAMKTGAMRADIRDVIVEQVNTQREKRVIKISLSNSIVDELIHYLKYHTIGHPALNQSFLGGYKKPTTPDTEPFNRSIFLERLRVFYESEIHRKLKLEGFL